MNVYDAKTQEVWPGFPDRGDMPALVRLYDWSATPLGPIEAWPQSLKTAVDLMLSSPQPVYVAWGPELTSLYNDAYIPILGAKHPAGLGQSFDELWSEIREEYRPLIEAVMQGEAHHFRDRPAALAGRDGVEVGYFTFSWTPLRDEAGVVRGFVCNGLETTDRVEAGRAFRRMFEASPTPFLVLSPDNPRFTITEVNDAYLAAVMRTREDLIGRGVFDAMPDNPDDPDATGVANLRASLMRAIASKRPDTMPLQRYDIPHPSGGFEERWWKPVNSPLVGAGGSVEAIIHHVVDVTEQHRAEQRLLRSEARYRELFNSIESGFCVVEVDLGSPNGRIDYRVVEANPAFYRQTGFPEGILGQWLREAAPDLEEHWFEAYGRVAQTGRPERFEHGSGMLRRWFDVYAFRTGECHISHVAAHFAQIERPDLCSFLTVLKTLRPAQQRLSRSQQ